MFTGIIDQTGHVTLSNERTLRIRCSMDELSVGDSIAVNGVCVTVVGLDHGEFSADLSEETKQRSNLGSLAEGDEVNLELPLALGDRLGGHMVQGHVDGVGVVTAVQELEGSVVMGIKVPNEVNRYLVEKGSVAVDGISLTVTQIDGDEFSVALVPHTLDATNLRARRPGDPVNIEVDILAKYVERLMGEEKNS